MQNRYNLHYQNNVGHLYWLKAKVLYTQGLPLFLTAQMQL